MLSKEFEEYERASEEIRKENDLLLEEFRAWLSGKGLKEKTVLRHSENVDFYINDFLLYDDATPARDGAFMVSSFFGHWFIRKAAWSSATSIKSSAASLNKFYGFMFETERVTDEEWQDVKEVIKEGMDKWLATVERYNDPDIEDIEDVWKW